MLLYRFDTLHFIALLSVLAYEAEGMLDVTFLSVHQLFFVFGLLAAIELEHGKAVDGKPRLSLMLNGDNEHKIKKIFKKHLKSVKISLHKLKIVLYLKLPNKEITFFSKGEFL